MRSGSTDKAMNNYQLGYGVDKQRMHVDQNKVPAKHEQVRRHDDIYLKNENEIKKHLSASVRDKSLGGSGAYMNKTIPPQSQQQKPKSLYPADPTKSVPKPNATTKPETSSYGAAPYHPPVTEAKQEPPPQPPVKKPSLFSPEKSPPQKRTKNSPVNPSASASSSGISSMTSPSESQRLRTSSSGSEPELRPVVRKIEQQQGFEMLLKEPFGGVKLHSVPDIITPITDPKEESSYSARPAEQIPPYGSAPLVNGIETNPTLISNLLKEAPSVPHLPAVAATTQPAEAKDKSHGNKKKNKEKHKHKDRSKEEKEKKKKHKDKDREKHKHRDKEKRQEEEVPEQPAEPIRLTIQKDRIQPVENPPAGGSLKIKIPKDKIKTEAPRTELKIKIPKEVIGNFDYSAETSGGGKKRERDRSSPTGAPPTKVPRSSGKYGEPKQNGRHSHGGKVSSYSSAPASRVQHQQQQFGPLSLPQQSLYPAQPPAGYYYYPSVQVPPPAVIPHTMNVPPPPYVYHQQFYGQGYVYPQEMYARPPPAGGNVPPPLPADAPPDVPPPPPPE